MIRTVDDAFVVRLLELTELALKTWDRCLREPQINRYELQHALAGALAFTGSSQPWRPGQLVEVYIQTLQYRGPTETEMVRELATSLHDSFTHTMRNYARPTQDERFMFDRLERTWSILDSSLRVLVQHNDHPHWDRQSMTLRYRSKTTTLRKGATTRSTVFDWFQESSWARQVTIKNLDVIENAVEIGNLVSRANLTARKVGFKILRHNDVLTWSDE